MLSCHYILNRSIVVIVDTEYTSVKHSALANEQIQNLFNGLDSNDYFGYISLGKNSQLDQLLLEKKNKNTHLKTSFLNKMSNKEPQIMLSQFDELGTSKQKRLEKALEKALAWQNMIEDKITKINDRVFIGPHKWIVCLIGGDCYTVEDFSMKYSRTLQRKTNLSISILGLSVDALSQHTNQYIHLTQKTKRGQYLNIVE